MSCLNRKPILEGSVKGACRRMYALQRSVMEENGSYNPTHNRQNATAPPYILSGGSVPIEPAAVDFGTPRLGHIAAWSRENTSSRQVVFSLLAWVCWSFLVHCCGSVVDRCCQTGNSVPMDDFGFIRLSYLYD